VPKSSRECPKPSWFWCTAKVRRETQNESYRWVQEGRGQEAREEVHRGYRLEKENFFWSQSNKIYVKNYFDKI